jgi:hypothetical protein
MPIANHAAHVVEQLTQLIACLNQAVQLTEEIIDASRNLGLALPRSRVPVVSGSFGRHDEGPLPQSSIADRKTFSVRWRNRTCYLGNSLPFRLLERLADRPNQLIHHDQLLDEVWECRRSRESIRSVVRVLRQKLCHAGMKDLAEAIDGTTARHYGLMLDGRL